MAENTLLSPKNAPLRRARALCVRYGPVLRILYAACWALLFFRHAFDYNERFFRVPLVLLSIPVLAGLPYGGIARFLRRSPIVWGLVGMMAAACLAARFSPFPGHRSYTHLVFGWFALTCAGFTMRLAFSGRALRVLLFAGLAGLGCSALWAALRVGLGFIEPEDVLLGLRVMLFTGYPATLGLMCGYFLTGYCYAALHKRSVAGKWPDRIGPLILLLLLLASQARTALVSVLGAVWLALLRAVRRPARVLFFSVVFFVILAGAAVLLSRTGPLDDSASYRRMVVMFTDPLSDPAVTGRLAIWEAAWASFKARPFSGTGMRKFPPAYAEYMATDGERLRATYRFVEPGGVHAHNLALGVLTEMGLAGFLSLALIYVGIFRVRGMRPGSDGDCLRMLFVYFLCQGCLDYMMSKIVYGDLFFGAVGLFLGAAFCAAHDLEARETESATGCRGQIKIAGRNFDLQSE
jgi:O-antigen ligase